MHNSSYPFLCRRGKSLKHRVCLPLPLWALALEGLAAAPRANAPRSGLELSLAFRSSVHGGEVLPHRPCPGAPALRHRHLHGGPVRVGPRAHRPHLRGRRQRGRKVSDLARLGGVGGAGEGLGEDVAGAGVGSEGRALEGLSESEGAEEEEERAREQPG